MKKGKKKENNEEKNSESSNAASSDEKTAKPPESVLAERITKAVKGLNYISETDAKVLPFIGKQTETATKEELLTQINEPADSEVEERDFVGFFAPLTEMQDWFGDEEKQTAEKFEYLKELLENNLRDLNVYKIGKVQLDVYVVGLDAENQMLGIKTKAVET
ncbi:MAG: nuclease A inhibitor family protein [Pyrinomonadaceae bacterium]